MTCRLCKKYNWDPPQPATYHVNDEGYCELHAPTALRLKSQEDEDQLNKLTLSLIRDAMTRGVECNLSGAIFPYGLKFPKEFSKENLPNINFIDATFEGPAYFHGLQFGDETHFTTASFQFANFNHAKFKSVDFSGAEFYKFATFQNIYVNNDAEFSNAIFFENVNFNRSTILSSDFSDTTFHKNSNFSQTKLFNKNDRKFLSFERALFKEKSFFNYSQLEECSFSGAHFFNGCDFSSSTLFGLLNLKNIIADKETIIIHNFIKDSLSNLLFTSSVADCFSFCVCDWPSKLYLEKFFDIPNSSLSQTYKEAEELYRSLKHKAADAHDQPLVSKWHYREKLMNLYQIKHKNPKTWWLSATSLYRITSGFGEDPIRASQVLIGLCLIPLVLLSFFKILDTGFEWWTINFAAIQDVIKNWVYYMPLAKPPQTGTTWGIWLSQAAIGAQTALFAFALRNKFRR